MPTAIIPDIHVQDSIYEVLRDVNDKRIKSEEFWIHDGGTEVRFTASGSDRLGSNTPSYTALLTPAAMQLDIYKDNYLTGLVRFGESRAQVKASGRVTSGDIFGSRALIGTDSGELEVLDMLTPELGAVKLDGHLLHTSVAQFFPSGQVALSAGMDFSIKLWDLASATVVQTLKHQKGMVDDVAMIGKGRNLLSLCEKTESIALWEVGKPQLVHEYRIPGVRCLDLWSSHAGKTDGSNSNDPSNLYDADGKVGLAGTDTAVLGFDIRSSMKEARVILEKPAHALAVSGNQLVWSTNNTVKATDLRMPNDDLYSVQLASGLNVAKLAVSPSKVYVSAGSSIYGYEPSSNSSEILSCEAQGAMIAHENELWHLGNNCIRHFPL